MCAQVIRYVLYSAACWFPVGSSSFTARGVCRDCRVSVRSARRPFLNGYRLPGNVEIFLKITLDRLLLPDNIIGCINRICYKRMHSRNPAAPDPVRRNLVGT